MSLIVLMAMKVEAGAIIADTGYAWKTIGQDIYRCEISGNAVTLVITGIGKVNSAWGLARAMQCDAGSAATVKPALILSLGTSGALDRTAVGTLVLCDEFVEHDMDVTAFGYPAGVTPGSISRNPVYRTADSATIAQVSTLLAEAGFSALKGRQLSGDLFIGDATLAEKKCLLFGGSDVVLVDMECAAIAKICATNLGIPYLAIRSVSDNADHNAGTSWDAEVVKAAGIFDSILRKLVSGPLNL